MYVFSRSLINYLLDLGIVDILLPFTCGVIIVGLYIAFNITKNYELLSLIFVIFLSFAFLPTMWLVAGGTYTSIPFYIIINAAIIVLLLNGLRRKIIVFLFALVVGALLVVEYQLPSMVEGYDSVLARYIDLAFSLFVCMFSIAVLMTVLIDSHMDELQKSKQYLTSLEELNKLLNDEKQKLKKLSITDYLTGAFNRRYITFCLNEEIRASRNRRKKLTVAMVDIDNFKTINDTYGHSYGDFVLRRVVSTIKKNVRQNDIVGRYGGDEFLIIMRNTSREEGYAIVERIRQKIQEIGWEKEHLVVTISGGVIEVGSEELTGLLKQVDELLYSAKHKSKNFIEKEVNAKEVNAQ
ncbi:MAG: diguanylate cyclase [Firmicutes bacterium]|nr:diguanylate cyclase [Bacillota bacterium]